MSTLEPFDPGPWARLRAHTPARIGLPRSGMSLATGAVLDLRAAHAVARDAVWTSLDRDALQSDLAAFGPPAVALASRARDRRTFLMRPDLGRALDAPSAAALGPHRGDYDLAIVVADGLSALAAQRQARALLAALWPALAGWRVAPLTIAEQARVALGDEVALSLGARSVLMLIGERPGLSATDSLGAYLTWGVRPFLTDADRNCVSNIRPEGVGHDEAARQIAYLLNAARAGGYSGVRLKNRVDEALAAQP